MSIEVIIKGNSETPEYKDALELKKIFERDVPDKHNGKILIISNATLFGQAVKDIDIIIIGSFEFKNNYKLSNIKTKFRYKENDNYYSTDVFEKKDVYISNFCFVIETKRHNADEIQLDGITLKVKYKYKWSDVTTQSEGQKYSLKSFFKDRLGIDPFICNFIWFRNVSQNSILDLVGKDEEVRTKHNFLHSDFNLKWLFQLAFIQRNPFKSSRYITFSSDKHLNDDILDIYKIFELFEKVKNGIGDLTRKKLEMITKKILGDQQYAQAIGEKLIVISGRAGTGKTIKLIRIASDLAQNQGNRSLILTYNHALVSDIQRIFALAGTPNSVDNYTVSISTLHKFFYELLIGFDIGTDSNKKFIPNYLKSYESLLLELFDYIDSGVINKADIQNLMKSRHDQLNWDNILIDEAQDWKDIEKKLIFKIFGKENVLVADGVDQLIRSQNKCNWLYGLKQNLDFKKTFEKKCLRQKVNLVNFVNAYADKVNINWNLEVKSELIGGKIIVSTKEYDKSLHQRELDKCLKSGNSTYEMMFLVPPSLVKKVKKETSIHRSFAKIGDFKKMGIEIWDGTNNDLRTQYPVELDSHRLFQYESCRGLEGWTVVCLELDEFIRYKIETYKEEATDKLALQSLDEKRNEFVYLWSLIPLTRAIDTVIITLKDGNSKISKILYDLYKKNQDFIEWID